MSWVAEANATIKAITPNTTMCCQAIPRNWIWPP